jgi:hypothetical protein
VVTSCWKSSHIHDGSFSVLCHHKSEDEANQELPLSEYMFPHLQLLVDRSIFHFDLIFAIFMEYSPNYGRGQLHL